MVENFSMICWYWRPVAETNFFGNESIKQNAVFLKSIDDALFMRNELVRLFEKAAIEKDPVEREKLLTVVIAGGGPYGRRGGRHVG